MNLKICASCGKALNQLPEENCERRITLFVVAGRPESEEARVLLSRMLPEFHHETEVCPSTMAKVYAVPFIWYRDRPCYTLNGIITFIEKQLQVAKPYSPYFTEQAKQTLKRKVLSHKTRAHA